MKLNKILSISLASCMILTTSVFDVEHKKIGVASSISLEQLTNDSMIVASSESAIKLKNYIDSKTVEKKYVKGYTTTSVNVRKGPSTDSDILDTYSFNQKIKYTKYDKDWVEIKYGDDVAYICKKYISKKKCEYIEYSVPSTSGFKSYMSYKCITSTNSTQYKLQRDRAYTGTYGIRQIDGRFCVAIGSYFSSSIGGLFDLVLENGTVIPCISADQKADIDTESNNIITAHNGCMSEFIVDNETLDKNAKRMGDISYCNDDWKSPVKYVRVYK